MVGSALQVEVLFAGLVKIDIRACLVCSCCTCFAPEPRNHVVEPSALPLVALRQINTTPSCVHLLLRFAVQGPGRAIQHPSPLIALNGISFA